MGVNIERFYGEKEKDLAACLAIYNEAIEKTTITFEEEPLSLETFASRVSDIAEQYPFFLAKDGAAVLGYAYLDRYHERSAYRYTADFSVYLAKEARGQGVGRQLYQAIEQAARQTGLRSIVSIITAENAPSVRLHEKLGFSYAGNLLQAGKKFGRWLDVLFYQKLL